MFVWTQLDSSEHLFSLCPAAPHTPLMNSCFDHGSTFTSCDCVLIWCISSVSATLLCRPGRQDVTNVPWQTFICFYVTASQRAPTVPEPFFPIWRPTLFSAKWNMFLSAGAVCDAVGTCGPSFPGRHKLGFVNKWSGNKLGQLRRQRATLLLLI